MPGIPSRLRQNFLFPQLTSHLDMIGLEPNGEFHGLLKPPRKSLQVPSTNPQCRMIQYDLAKLKRPRTLEPYVMLSEASYN